MKLYKYNLRYDQSWAKEKARKFFIPAFEDEKKIKFKIEIEIKIKKIQCERFFISINRFTEY